MYWELSEKMNKDEDPILKEWGRILDYYMTSSAP